MIRLNHWSSNGMLLAFAGRGAVDQELLNPTFLHIAKCLATQLHPLDAQCLQNVPHFQTALWQGVGGVPPSYKPLS